jgi:hypothetical protein
MTRRSHQQSERSPTLGRRDAQTAAVPEIRDQNTEIRSAASGVVERPERIETEPISDL